MTTPQKLACPTCGAPLPADAEHRATTCPFCGAVAAPAPRVIERVVERIVVAQAEASSPSTGGPCCPRCARVLEDVRSGAKVVGVCTRCGGVWIDRETTDYLTRVSDPDLELAVRRAVGIITGPPMGTRQVALSCPVCADATRRVEIANTVNGVDVCDAHGTWFDRDELEMFVKSHVDARAGEIDGDDLRAAGVEGGFFSKVFRSLFGGEA